MIHEENRIYTSDGLFILKLINGAFSHFGASEKNESPNNNKYLSPGFQTHSANGPGDLYRIVFSATTLSITMLTEERDK